MRNILRLYIINLVNILNRNIGYKHNVSNIFLWNHFQSIWSVNYMEGTSKLVLNFLRYSWRHSMSSAGLLYGNQTGSPTKYLFAFMKF